MIPAEYRLLLTDRSSIVDDPISVGLYLYVPNSDRISDQAREAVCDQSGFASGCVISAEFLTETGSPDAGEGNFYFEPPESVARAILASHIRAAAEYKGH